MDIKEVKGVMEETEEIEKEHKKAIHEAL